MKEVSRKLFSSEQASDGREAHRGSVSGSEHSWAVQQFVIKGPVSTANVGAPEWWCRWLHPAACNTSPLERTCTRLTLQKTITVFVYTALTVTGSRGSRGIFKG